MNIEIAKRTRLEQPIWMPRAVGGIEHSALVTLALAKQWILVKDFTKMELACCTRRRLKRIEIDVPELLKWGHLKWVRETGKLRITHRGHNCEDPKGFEAPENDG